jgi:hypothetical protein
MVVEICLQEAKFLGFSKNERVYDELLIGQPRVKVRTNRRAGVNRSFFLVAGALSHQGEK